MHSASEIQLANYLTTGDFHDHLLRHWYRSLCSDLGRRFDEDDLVGELYEVGLKLIGEGRDPVKDEPLFKTAFLNRIRDLIDHHKCGTRDYHRDLCEAQLSYSGEDDDERNPLDAHFDDCGGRTQDFANNDIVDAAPLGEDAPDNLVSLKESVERIKKHLTSFRAHTLFRILTDIPDDLPAAWEEYKATVADRGRKAARLDGRTPFGLPWRFWTIYLGWPTNQIKDAIKEIRTAAAHVFGYQRIFKSGLQSYAWQQISEDLPLSR